MANQVHIRYHGETLCSIDPSEVKSVEPYSFKKIKPQNIFKRIYEKVVVFLKGSLPKQSQNDYEEWTRISFRDGTWIRVKIPFLEFIEGYA